jgi:hypothetical protein
MNHKTTGNARASAKSGRPKRPTYSLPKGREVREIKGREVRETQSEPKPENKTGLTERREQKTTDRAVHKAMLETVRKAAVDAIRPLASQVEALRQEAVKKDAEMDFLMRRVARLEASQKAQENTSRVPQLIEELEPL